MSPFDQALGTLPPPPGLSQEQQRRAVFEELNYLPWSEGLEPAEDGSWLGHAPPATGLHPESLEALAPYRLTAKVAKRVVDRMRADGLIGPEIGVGFGGGLEIYQGKGGLILVGSRLGAVYGTPPLVHFEIRIFWRDQPPSVIRPRNVFLDPNLGALTSDEDAERVIRQLWRYGELLHRTLEETLHSLPLVPS